MFFIVYIDLTQVCIGYGGFGALGHSVYHRKLLPRSVKGSKEGTIQHIATSGTHTAAVIIKFIYTTSCNICLFRFIMEYHNTVFFL